MLLPDSKDDGGEKRGTRIFWSWPGVVVSAGALVRNVGR